MTVEKAISILRHMKNLMYIRIFEEEALQMGIDTIEEIQQYRAIGTVEELRELKEKATEKRPIDDAAFGICPCCHNEFNSELTEEYDLRYCLYCGQAIDWSEGKEQP